MRKFISVMIIGLVVFCGISDAITTKQVAPKKRKPVVKKVVKKVVPIVVPIVEPTPAPIAPAPIAAPPAPVYKGIFGLGINTKIVGIYTSCIVGGNIGLKASIPFSDPWKLAAYIGLAPSYSIGLGGISGQDINGNDIKAIPLYVDAVVGVPVLGYDTYVSGGVNYTLMGTNRVAGALGGEVVVGVNVDPGYGIGKTGIELGYNVIRAGGATPTVSSKGWTLGVAKEILF